MTSNGLQLSFLILGAIFWSVSSRGCPETKAILPCTCEADSTLHCHGPGVLPLSHVFGAVMNYSAHGDRDYHWTWLDVNGTENQRISLHTFSSITFNALSFTHNPNLRLLDPLAFTRMTSMLQIITLIDNPALSSSKELFSIFRSAPNLGLLTVKGTGLQEIPPAAFGSQLNLDEIEFSGNPIQYIGKEAFGGLKNLRTLTLANNVQAREGGRLFIHSKAFHFSDQSDKELTLSLVDYGLSHGNFKAVNLTGFNGRSVLLSLEANHGLDHLDEEQFEGFLRGNPANRVRIFSFPSCDNCGLEWLVTKGVVDKKVVGWDSRPVQCIEGQRVRNLADQDFSHCHHS